MLLWYYLYCSIHIFLMLYVHLNASNTKKLQSSLKKSCSTFIPFSYQHFIKTVLLATLILELYQTGIFKKLYLMLGCLLIVLIYFNQELKTSFQKPLFSIFIHSNIKVSAKSYNFCRKWCPLMVYRISIHGLYDLLAFFPRIFQGYYEVVYINHFHTPSKVVLCNNWSFYLIYLWFPQEFKNVFT